METENVIEIPLKNQNYDISQDFVDVIFKNFEWQHTTNIVFMCMNGDNIKSIKLLMNIIDELLDHISKNENNLMEFKNIAIFYKYLDFLFLKNIKLIYQYLDTYSKNFDCDQSFFTSFLVDYTKNYSIVSSFYYYFIILDHIKQIANNSTKENYTKNILIIIDKLLEIIDNENNYQLIDIYIQNYFENK